MGGDYGSQVQPIVCAGVFQEGVFMPEAGLGLDEAEQRRAGVDDFGEL